MSARGWFARAVPLPWGGHRELPWIRCSALTEDLHGAGAASVQLYQTPAIILTAARLTSPLPETQHTGTSETCPLWLLVAMQRRCEHTHTHECRRLVKSVLEGNADRQIEFTWSLYWSRVSELTSLATWPHHRLQQAVLTGRSAT